MEFSELPEFQSDLKRLTKRFRTLKDDLEILKKVLSTESVNHPQPPLSFRISGLSVDTPFVIKVKKMACRSLKGKGANTGLRVIYAYHPQEQHIQLIEIYFKADQENEDRARILKHFS